jgi:hypothetical protein
VNEGRAQDMGLQLTMWVILVHLNCSCIARPFVSPSFTRRSVAGIFAWCCTVVVLMRRCMAVVFERRCTAVVFAQRCVAVGAVSRGSRLCAAWCGVRCGVAWGRLRVALRGHVLVRRGTVAWRSSSGVVAWPLSSHGTAWPSSSRGVGWPSSLRHLGVFVAPPSSCSSRGVASWRLRAREGGDGVR